MMERTTLDMRVAAIVSRRDATSQKMKSITAEFMARLHPNDDGEGPRDINTEWAFQAEQIVNGVVALLIAHQETSLDGELIDARRKVAIQQAETLSDCLSKFHIPYSGQDESAAVMEDGNRAESNLENCISALGKSADDLDAAFGAGLEQLRSRIRRIDALIIRDKRPSD
jgi:hypothetical protein